MATISDLALGALRVGGVIGEADAGTAFEIKQAETALLDFLASFPLRSIGGKLDEVTVTQSMTVISPSRLIVSASGAVTITLPDEPYDGYTIEVIDADADFATHPVTLARNKRKIAGAAANATLNVDGTAQRYFYRADLADWTEWKTRYASSDESPLPAEFDEALKYYTSVTCGAALGTDFSAPSRSWVPAAADTGLRRLAARYGPQRRLRVDDGLLRMPSTTLRRGNQTTRIW